MLYIAHLKTFLICSLNPNAADNKLLRQLICLHYRLNSNTMQQLLVVSSIAYIL